VKAATEAELAEAVGPQAAQHIRAYFDTSLT
jgi:hypothetical protein